MELINIKVCPVCKRTFVPAPMHAYRYRPDRRQLVCSYPCLNKSYDIHESRKTREYRGQKS